MLFFNKVINSEPLCSLSGNVKNLQAQMSIEDYWEFSQKISRIIGYIFDNFTEIMLPKNVKEISMIIYSFI